MRAGMFYSPRLINYTLAMRSLLTISFFFLSLNSFPTWGASMADLVLRDGLFYERLEDVPFSGELNDERTKGVISKGKQEGLWTVYWINGTLSSKGHYKDGKNEGTWVHYHDNGQLWTSESWKNGRQSGLSITYWDNGTIRSKGTYKNGKREGSWTSYWKNGEISEWETGEFKNGLRIGN